MGALPERGVRERVQRLVQRPDLAAHLRRPFGRLQPLVDPVEPLDDLVKPIEERVELPVRKFVSVHASRVYGATRIKSCRPPACPAGR